MTPDRATEARDKCMDCGGFSPYWHAANDLWARVMGDGKPDPVGTICPTCFAVRADAKNLPESELRWIWSPEPLRMVPDSEVLDAYERRRAAEARIDTLTAALVEARDKVSLWRIGNVHTVPDMAPALVAKIDHALGGGDAG